jgi:hypothetical protein
MGRGPLGFSVFRGKTPKKAHCWRQGRGPCGRCEPRRQTDVWPPRLRRRRVLHGITFACGWGAGTVQSKAMGTGGLGATMQVSLVAWIDLHVLSCVHYIIHMHVRRGTCRCYRRMRTRTDACVGGAGRARHGCSSLKTGLWRLLTSRWPGQPRYLPCPLTRAGRLSRRLLWSGLRPRIPGGRPSQ